MSEKVKTTQYFDGYKLGRPQKIFMVIAALTYAFDIMDMALFNMVAPILQTSYHINNEQLRLLGTLFFVGALCGSIVGGKMSDVLGRKKTLLLNVTIFSLASLANAMWQPHYLYLLELSRFFTGFGTMSACSVAIAYISEMLPADKRGKYQSITLGLGTFSLPLISLIAAQIATAGANGWRIILAFGGMMLLLVPIGAIYLVESPRWLISKGKVAEAEKVMKKCLSIDVDMTDAYKNYQKSIAAYTRISFGTQMKIAFAKGQMRQSIVCILFITLLGCANQFTGTYVNVFLVNMGFPLQAVLFAGALAVFGQPIGELLSSLYSDKGGRKIPIVILCATAAILSVGVGLINTVWAYTVIQLIKALFASGAMALMLTYIPESFPTSIRGSAVGYCYAIQRTALAFIPTLCLLSYNAGGWLGANLASGILWAAAACIVGLFGKEPPYKMLMLCTALLLIAKRFVYEQAAAISKMA